MLSNNIITKLLGFEDVIVKNIEENSITKTIHIEMPLKQHICPCCGKPTKYVHDYRYQQIKDIPSFGMNSILLLRKRRYVCKECGKKFYENIDFLPKYYRMTNRLPMYIIDKLRDVRSFSSVAKEVNLSVTTVIRIFDIVNYTMPKNPPQINSMFIFIFLLTYKI